MRVTKSLVTNKEPHSKRYKDLMKYKVLIESQWDDEKLDYKCFYWLVDWKTGPTYPSTWAQIRHTSSLILPTKVYSLFSNFP